MDRPFPRSPLPPRVVRYDTPTIVLHWITAALVGLLWIIGQTINLVPEGNLRIDYRSGHILLGVVLAVVLITRLIWRVLRGMALPPDRHRLLALAAKAIHWSLYLLLAATIVLGILNAWSHGEVIFNLFRLPAFGDRPLRRLISGWHALAANAVLIVAGLHAAAALSHHYVLRDHVLVRMMPILRAQRGQAPQAQRR
ncbi:MAG TPA: cytochrome b/b6 domain-containing protein [Acetobacteraceae bacterium]|nr:cytochrome b/b6 domain-containing protein [Acetobacteraceae bacterium]